MAKLTIHPPGTQLEPDHPFATPQIIFGQKPPASWNQSSTPPSEASPSSAPNETTPMAGEKDIAIETMKELGWDKDSQP